MTSRMPVNPEEIGEALQKVRDPELGMSVADLGLIYGVRIEGGRVRIAMTLTTRGCPLHDAMTEWVRRAVGGVPGVEDVEVDLTFDPPWTPDRIAPRARR